LQSASLQSKLIRHSGIVASGPTIEDALCMALWQSQMEDQTSDWLRVVSISSLGQTMNACSKVFTGDIYGDHVVSCVGIIGIKHQHNVVRDTLVDICFRSGISAGKEVDIGFGEGHDKPLRLADMLLYSWDGGLDVYIGYGFISFLFSSLGELMKDAVVLLKRIRKFSMTQDIGTKKQSKPASLLRKSVMREFNNMAKAAVAKKDIYFAAVLGDCLLLFWCVICYCPNVPVLPLQVPVCCSTRGLLAAGSWFRLVLMRGNEVTKDPETDTTTTTTAP
ncbi:hypothetical protein Tco_0785207, partial [Tanacetum coccineum]